MPMADDDLPRLIYLVVLATAIAGWYIAEHRGALGRTLRMALVWGMIFLGVVAGYGLWTDVQGQLVPDRAMVTGDGGIEIARAADGHFHMTVAVNDTPVRFIVDTGASDVVLTRRDAERVGIRAEDLVFTGIARTANGTVRTAFTRVDSMEVGPVAMQGVGVSVNEGEMDTSLLGMAFLNRFERIEIAGGRLRLEP